MCKLNIFGKLTLCWRFPGKAQNYKTTNMATFFFLPRAPRARSLRLLGPQATQHVRITITKQIVKLRLQQRLNFQVYALRDIK